MILIILQSLRIWVEAHCMLQQYIVPLAISQDQNQCDIIIT